MAGKPKNVLRTRICMSSQHPRNLQSPNPRTTDAHAIIWEVFQHIYQLFFLQKAKLFIHLEGIFIWVLCVSFGCNEFRFRYHESVVRDQKHRHTRRVGLYDHFYGDQFFFNYLILLYSKAVKWFSNTP